MALISAISAILSKLLTDEIKAWSPRMAQRLIRYAASRLPEHLHVRYQEEWASYVGDTPGDVGKLVAAAGLLFAARRMALTNRQRTLISLSRALAQLDVAHSLASRVVSLIQENETLPSHGELLRVAEEINSGLSKSQENRNRLATQIETLSAVPENWVTNLVFALYRRTTARYSEKVLRETMMATERSTKAVDLIEEKRGQAQLVAQKAKSTS